MGYNLSGVVISRNFRNNITELGEQLGLDLELDKRLLSNSHLLTRFFLLLQ